LVVFRKSKRIGRMRLFGDVAYAVIVWLVCLFSPGCIDSDDACPKGMERVSGEGSYLDGYCVEVGAGADTATNTGGADIDGGLDSGGSDGDENSLMGDDRYAQDDCVGEVNWCALPPTGGVGFCTTQNCTQNPDSCPEGFFCFDPPSFDSNSTELSYCFSEAVMSSL
jgi:hypothetical protein